MTRHILGAAMMLCILSNWAQAQDRKLITLSSITYASAVYDTYTTMQALDRCRTCYEGNTLMRPFVANKGTAYAFTMGLTTAATYGTIRLRERNVRWWWVPMAATIALHVTAGIHNQRISSR